MATKRSGWLSRLALAGLLGASLALAPLPIMAQSPAPITSWNGYNVQNTIEVGGRVTSTSGNQENYNTLVNLHSGVRLFNFNLGLRAQPQSHGWFDELQLSGFGFGGDPNDVARLHISKSKAYDFNALFRRDNYFFGYNFLANPLNPSGAHPTVPITNALHSIDYVRNMSDYNLTLLPQSSFRVRLGYSHLRETGPSLTTVGAAMDNGVAEVGNDAELSQQFSTSTDLYRAGFDVLPAARTRLSFMELVQHTKGDTSLQDLNRLFLLPGGTPVDLGVVWSGTSSCFASPVPVTVPPASTVNPTPACSGLTAYTGDQRPRITLPTEQVTLESNYFRNLAVDGLFSYSSAVDKDNNEFARWSGYSSRILAGGDNETGTGHAKRVLINGNLAAVYDATSKFHITESTDYNSFRIPSQLGFLVLNTYYQAPASLAGTPAVFNSTTCPAPYTASTCPQHNTESAPDFANGNSLSYLGQNYFTETLRAGYDFSSRFGAQLGYRYTYRTVYDYNAIDYASEVFYPGGSLGAADAARGDCALPKGGTLPGSLPAGCTLEPDGSVVFTGFTPASDTTHNQAVQIHGNTALFNTWALPVNSVRISFALEAYSADHSFTRITPRQYQHYTLQFSFKPVDWAQLASTVNLYQGRDNVAEVKYKDHDRSYGANLTLMPVSRIFFDAGYNYEDIYNQAIECYASGFGAPPAGASLCPETDSPVPLGALSTYASKQHSLNADLRWKPVKLFSLRLGMAGSYVNGLPQFFALNTGGFIGNFLNPRTPWGPLSFSYQEPYAHLTVNFTKNVAYTMGWQLYDYRTHGNQSPNGLAPIGSQSFKVNAGTFGIRFSL